MDFITNGASTYSGIGPKINTINSKIRIYCLLFYRNSYLYMYEQSK